MTTNLDRAGIVSRHVQLKSVDLAGSSLHTEVPWLDTPDELELEQGYKATYHLEDDHPDHLFVRLNLRLLAFEVDEADGGGREVFELEATYGIVYRLKAAATYPEDALQHFAELNGGYNGWPYWREFVQNMTGRMGISSILVPVFRPPVRKLEEEESPEELEATAKEGAAEVES